MVHIIFYHCVLLLCVVDLDVWWYVGNSAVFARRSYIQKEIAVQVANRRQRFEEELHPSSRSVDGRLRQVLLRKDR